MTTVSASAIRMSLLMGAVGVVFALAAPGTVTAQEPTPAAKTARQATVSSVADLAGVLKSGDQVFVKTLDQRRWGTFVQATGQGVVITVDKQPWTVPAADVVEVRREGRRQIKRGLLYGFVCGAAIANGVILANRSDSDWSIGESLVFGTVAGGATGLAWGAIVGALIRETPVVYRAGGVKVGLTPMLGDRSAGVMLTVRLSQER